jgi:hypothetical protein
MATPLCLLLQNVWIKDSTLHTLHSRLHPSHFTLHKLPTSIAFGFVDSISFFWNTFAVLFEELFSISPGAMHLPLLWLPLLLMLLLLLMMMTTMKMVMMLMLMLVLLSILLLLLLMLVTGKIQ